ncbi:putative Histidine kinase [Candidatus Terasakiella magnetica]|nr:putative Histidine kinase [Candidatus Terasakiella magnetica]
MSTSRPKVLIVDDKAANRLALRKVLSKLECEIIEAGGGNDALALCLDHEFAVLLFDIEMPGMDGYELAELLRGDPKTAQVPLIYLTASYSDETHRKRGYGVGAVEYIQKPVDDYIVRSKVAVFLELYLIRRSLEEELAHSTAISTILRESEARLRHAVSEAPIPIMLHADDGAVILLSRTWSELTGYTQVDIPTTQDWAKRAYGSKAPEKAAYIQSLYDIKGPRNEGEARVTTASGSVRIWDFHSAPVEPLPDGRRLVISMAVDVTERHSAEDALRVSEQKFRNLVETIADMIWETDVAGCFTYVSPRCRDLLDCEPETLLGRPLTSLCRPQDCPRVEGAMASGRVNLDLILQGPGGRQVSTETDIIPTFDAAGTATGYRGTTRDISVRKKVQAELARKTTELERSNSDLEQFAYVASHDLREPLRMVNSFLSLLERRCSDKLDEEEKEYIAFAKEGAVRMDALILDLLEYSRIGRNALPDEPIPLSEPLETALANLALTLEENNAEVTVESELPALCIDSLEFVRLFQNLIGNAIKYRAPDRAPRVDITATKGEGEWEFHFTDNGIGIEPQYFDRIFQIFQRLHTRSETAGTGIGLAVCKRVVGRYRGRIWVESEPGKGSTFCFTIPDSKAA